MSARDRDDELEDEFERRIRRSRERIERGKREKGESFWRYIGMIGTVGWTVVVPMVLATLVGAWVDKKYETGSSWTLGLLIVGLCVGCFNAWRLITREQ